MARPFSALTKAGSTRFTGTLFTNRALTPSIRFVGAWRDRRFVIVNLEPADPVVAAHHDLEGLTLTLPVVADADYYVRECARFGAVVAAAFRKRGEFENIVGSDSKGHIVHAFHHVALCGFKGPWSISKSSFAGACADCQRVASTPPAHRALMHPLTKKQMELKND